MTSKTVLESDLRDAMRSGDDVRKRTLRMILSSIKLAEVDKRGELTEGEIDAILQKEVKTRNESIAEAEGAGREDVASSTRVEVDVIAGYLPEPLSPDELDRIVRDAVAASGASGPQDMGKVMKTLMPMVQGRADGKAVSAKVREVLGAG
jgi:uncharacterized protein YqeY